MNTRRIYAPGPTYPDMFSRPDTPIMEPVDVCGWLVNVQWREVTADANSGEERGLEVVAQDAAEAKRIALWAARNDWAHNGFDFVAATPVPIAIGTISQNMIDAYCRWRRETASEFGHTARETAA